MVERAELIAMVHGLQNGDPDASGKLFETFQSDIYYFILKTVNNDRELAEDLTQDTFVEILETIDKLQEPAAFVTWSKQIAYHKCTAYFRKRKELLVDEDEDGYSVFDTIEEEDIDFIPDAALDQQDLKQTIINMINDLPEEQKSAILLRYFNEISVKEIAEIQGVTEGTVKSRLNYGRKAIKQSVEEYEKKNDIKLHCAGVLPLLLWLFKDYRIKKDLHISSNTASQEFIIEEETFAEALAGAAASAAAETASITAASVTTASTTKAVMAFDAKMLTTKIVAGVAAAAVTISSITVGINKIRTSIEESEQTVIETIEEEQNELMTTESDVDVFYTEAIVESNEEEAVEEETESFTETQPDDLNDRVIVDSAAHPSKGEVHSTEAPMAIPAETPTEAPMEDSNEMPTVVPAEDSTSDEQSESKYKEVTVGGLTYVYSSDVEDPYRDGNTVYYPYDPYFP